DPKTGQVQRSTSAYEHPAPHACLPYDERINTDRGLLPIGEVVAAVQAGVKLLTYDRFGRPTPILAGVCNGKRFVVRLDLADGSSLRLTSDMLFSYGTAWANSRRSERGIWRSVRTTWFSRGCRSCPSGCRLPGAS